MVQTTWNVKLRRAEVLNMSWSGAAVVAGELLDKHGYQYTFCIAAGLSAVALACSRLSSFSQNSRDFHSNLSKFRPMQMLQNLKDSKVELQKRWWLWWIHSPLEDFWQQSCWAKAVPLSRCGPRNPISGITMLGSHWASLSTLWHNAPSWRAKDCETSSKNGKAVKHVWDLELTRILQYFTLTRCIHAGFGAILPCFPQDYPKIFDPRQLLAELDEEPTVQATAARLREAWLSFWTAGYCRDTAGSGTTLSPCVVISWWSKLFDILDPGCESTPVGGKRVGKQFLLRLPNFQDLGFIKSGYKQNLF